jgi:hypothetical protein
MTLSDENRQRIERLLADVDFAQGGQAEVRQDGYLWTRTTRTKAWHRSTRIRGGEAEVRAAAAWLRQEVAERTATPPAHTTGFPVS